MNYFVWILLSFVSGAVPYSVLLGKLALKTDIRAYGDGNPGATNVFRAGSKRLGILAILLDFGKAAVPVALANFLFHVDGWLLTAVAIAPVLGHAFSPFLRFRGGKALAATFGSWTGLTLFVAPLVLGLAFALWLKLLVVEGWAVIAGMLTLFVFLLLVLPQPVYLFTWGGIMFVLIWKHRTDLRRRPSLQAGWLGRFIRPKQG